MREDQMPTKDHAANENGRGEWCVWKHDTLEFSTPCGDVLIRNTAAIRDPFAWRIEKDCNAEFTDVVKERGGYGSIQRAQCAALTAFLAELEETAAMVREELDKINEGGAS